MSIRIDVVRDDGQVTRLLGESGMATCMGHLSAPVQESDPPTVSFRCTDDAELAWNLAALLAGVRHLSPHAYRMAHELERYCDFGRLQVVNRLPPEGEVQP